MYSENMIRRSWVEVDINQLEKNYIIYKNSLSENIQIMAVIKADAYGHGAVEIAKRLSKIGVVFFAVSNISEAIELRKNGVTDEILILGYTPIENADDLVKYDIIQTLVDENYAELLSNSTTLKIKAQIAIDTGMNRIGIDSDNGSYCEEKIRLFAEKFNLTGMFTHLCVADSVNENNITFTNTQIKKFYDVVESVSDLQLPYCHCLNSAGGLYHNNNYNTKKGVVRLGIVLYGLKPDRENILPIGIKPVISWKSVISMIKKVYPGEYIGYGRSYQVEKEMIIATVPTGYADGYSRLLSNNGYVFVNGEKSAIVGRICMDQMMIDVTNISGLSIGDTVILLDSDNYTADDMAKQIGTIGYEVVCNISKRVPRIYINR